MWFFVLFAVFGSSLAAPGYFYYGPPSYQRFMFYNHEYPSQAPQRQMMVQYQPQWMHQTSSTAEGGVSAFVAGNSGSAGTVFHSPPPESDQESSSNVEESLTSAAEAYDPIPEVPDVPEATEVTEKSAKKVKVSLESAEVEADYDDDRQRPQRPQRPPPPSSSASAPETDGNYFPVNFHGATSGAAIAIANSYSTGKGGSAVSHATAYGNPMIPKKTSRS